MNSITKAILVVLALTLSGCSWFSKKDPVVLQPIPRAELVVPPVDKIRMDPVVWTVITEENAPIVFKEKESPVYFGLTADGYENLSVNNAKTIALIRQLRATIDAYADYYARQNQLLDKYIEEQEND